MSDQGTLVVKLLNPETVLADLSGKFFIGESFADRYLKVKYTCVTRIDELDHVQTKKRVLRSDSKGAFRINFPEDTYMFALSVKVKASLDCNTTTLTGNIVFPADQANLMSQTDLPLRLMINDCNFFAVNTSGWDHANAKEQAGPVRSARAMAMIHMGMFEALLAIEGGYQSYFDEPFVFNTPISTNAAICQTAYKLLSNLFPKQAARMTKYFNAMALNVEDLTERENGIALGNLVAQRVIDNRANDGSNFTEVSYDQYVLENPIGNTPGLWSKDPISKIPVAVGYKWDQVKPFVIDSATQFRCPPPPALNSVQYTTAFNEVKSLGGDGKITFTSRSNDQTQIGLYWAYDGTPTLCAPPRLYNQIAHQLALQMNLTYAETLRLFAILNISMADAGLTSWESKYYWKVWRPVTGIRETNYDNVPAPDGNADTVADPNWRPLGAPNTNTSGVYFTPPFPSYPSGHATFGGALFQVLRNILGKDDIPFTFVSDELNGVTLYDGITRPLAPRAYTSLSQAEEENGQSRIYLGIHWYFDKTSGIKMGNDVANFIADRLYVPL